MIIILLILALVVLWGYLYSQKTYWQRRGVETYKGKMKNRQTLIADAYLSFKSKHLRHGGMILAYKPFYVPVDIDIIRSIMIKNFDSFVNHDAYVNEKTDPLGGHLLNLRDEKWRRLRTTLTPTFTSGKMKMMFHTMTECTKELVNVLDETSSIGDPVDAKDILARFTTDVIGSVAFGIECNSLKNPESEFRQYGRKIGKRNWRKFVSRILPHSIQDLIKFNRHTRDMTDFFINTTKSIVDYREKNHVYRKDFMHLMLQLKNRGKVTDDGKIMNEKTVGNFMKIPEIAAQLFVFFVAGFETSSILMSFALLELAQAQDIQDKLREEMKSVIKKYGGLTYEAIMEMNYLDQVVNETLRLHPPAAATERVANKDFPVPGSDVVIQKGTEVLISIMGIHRDPEFYPAPLKFKPERFSAENKKNRDPMTFMPFGEGPRMCIGARFGLLQSKVGLATVLTNFKVTLNKKTVTPVEYDPKSFLLDVKGGLWFDFEKVK